jgi:hypothetical protein
MANLNLHNYGGLTGNQIVRVPHCGGKGLTVGGSQIDVDDMGGQLYIKRNLSSTNYIATYAVTSNTQTLAPANVWDSYDALTSSIPEWLTSSGTIDANGVHLDGIDSLLRTNQALTNIIWGFKFKLDRPGSIKISVGSWSAEIISGTNYITFRDGSISPLKLYIHDSEFYDVILQQKQSVVSQTATMIFRLGNITVTDVASETFSSTDTLKIEGEVTIKGWRQGVSAELSPTLSLVESRSAGTYNDVDSNNNLYWGEMKTGYFNTSLYSYKYNNTEYQLAGWTKNDYTGAGYIEQRTLPNGAWTKILDIPQSYVGGVEQGTWFPMRQWNWAQDSRGWLYLGTYGLGTPFASSAPYPDPPPSVYRSRDNGATWERLPDPDNINGQRHCHSIYYNPDHDTLYVSYGEYGQTNLYKYSNLSDTTVGDLVVSKLQLVSRKGGISTRYNGTETLFLPPDEFPVSFIRVNMDTDTVYAGAAHRGLFGCIKFALAPIPTDFGTLLLSDATNPPEIPGIFLSYIKSSDTIEDVTYTNYRHSAGTIRYTDDIAYLGWNSPPIAHAGTNGFKTGGAAVHEYWNGNSWVEMTVASVTNGYSLPTDITDWGKAKPSDFGVTAWSDEYCYWTRIRVTANYPSGKSAYASDDYDHHRVLLAIYSAYGDSCDTEVEWKIKTDDPYAEGSSSRDILFWESWKQKAVWSEMPFQLTASGSLNSTTLDPQETILEPSGSVRSGFDISISDLEDINTGTNISAGTESNIDSGSVVYADKEGNAFGGVRVAINRTENIQIGSRIRANKNLDIPSGLEVANPTFDLEGFVNNGAIIDIAGFVISDITEIYTVPELIFVNGKPAINIDSDIYKLVSGRIIT